LVALLRSRGLVQDITSEELEKVGSNSCACRQPPSRCCLAYSCRQVLRVCVPD
jgi:hypothetical protein